MKIMKNQLENKYNKTYQNLVEMSGDIILNEKFPALGLTSNLDILCNFNIKILNALLIQYLPFSNLLEMKPAAIIYTIEEFLETVVYYCMNGFGGEVDISDVLLLKELFQERNGMGGTATQAAMALASIGITSLVHLTDDSKEVCEILNSPYIFTIDSKGNKVQTCELSQTKDQEIHYIIQFKKNDLIRLGDQEILIPTSNRLIVTHVTVNGIVPLNEAFFTFVEDNAEKITSHDISSFNSIRDLKILEERLYFIKAHLLTYRLGNAKGIVFYEDAHYHSDSIRRMCVQVMYPEVDIVSLNEEELFYTLKLDGFDIDINDILSCIEGMKYLKKSYHVQKGIIVHTKDYSMYVGDSLAFDIEKGLMYGNLLATSKAMFGHYGSLSDISEVLKLSLSEKGIQNLEVAEGSSTGCEVILVPSKYIDKPKYTIGLGDSFVAGVQISFKK